MKKFLLLIAILLLANCTFAYTSNIDGVVENIAAKHSLNPYKLKALTILISNQQISLSGFDAMHVGIYPGMSNESLVFELGKIIDKYDTNSNSSKLNNFINSLSSQVANKSVNTLLQETVLNLKRADNAYFDTQVINQYYDLLLEGGKSKAEAWTLAMKEQDAYRATQDTRKVITENNNRIYIAEQENYVYSLYNQMMNSKSPETRIRLSNMINQAYQIIEQNKILYKQDPVLYFIQKDPYLPQASVNNPQYYKERFQQLDFHYDKTDIKYKLRTYLTNEEKKELVKEIKYSKNLNFKEKEIFYIDLNYRYGNYYGKDYLSLIIKNLLYENLIANKDIAFMKNIKAYHKIKDFIKTNIIKILIGFILLIFISYLSIYFICKNKKYN